MKTISFAVFALVLALFSPVSAVADTVDGRVLQVQLPREDVTLFYIEARSGFTVKMKTETAAVEGQKLYIGDGKVAIDLVAHSTQGIYLQGVKYRQGDQFKNGATIKVLPGFRNAAELKPGDVYVTLPGVAFELPEE